MRQIMQAINVATAADRFLISIDRSLITKEIFLRLLNQRRRESLAQRVDFDESVEEFGEEAKDSWWLQNKARLLHGAE